jgi:hypothetical protein
MLEDGSATIATAVTAYRLGRKSITQQDALKNRLA